MQLKEAIAQRKAIRASRKTAKMALHYAMKTSSIYKASIWARAMGVDRVPRSNDHALPRHYGERGCYNRNNTVHFRGRP